MSENVTIKTLSHGKQCPRSERVHLTYIVSHHRYSQSIESNIKKHNQTVRSLSTTDTYFT